MTNVRADVVVVAAGTSRRMGDIDKLEAEVAGRPLLAWTLAGLAASSVVERIVLATAPDRVERLRTLPWVSATTTEIVAGGNRRQESVAAGVAALARLNGIGVPAGAPPASDRSDPVVLVHDGARPVVSHELVERVAVEAARHGAAVPVVPVTETVKRVSEGRVLETVDRSDLATAQTPQGARLSLLVEAFRRFPAGGPDIFTDEAALLEACRIAVHAVPGDPENLKVTMPADLERVAVLLASSVETRTALGRDSHPFGPGAPLALGGLVLDGPRLYGHSDGDVVLHAVADALLGATGQGDLGRQFPPDERTPEGVSSRDLLTAIVERLARAGARARSIDVTIVGARPRLGDSVDRMGVEIAGIVGLPVGAVSVKASTGNHAGMEGAGRGISADAVAVVEVRSLERKGSLQA